MYIHKEWLRVGEPMAARQGGMPSRQDIIDARMNAVKSKLEGPKADYTINKGKRDWDAILFWSAETGDLKKVKKAIKKGANINWVSPSNKSSAAHIAAWFKRPKILKYLKKKGANLQLKDSEGRTPEDIWQLTKDQRDLTKAMKRYQQQQAAKKKKAEEARILLEKKAAIMGGNLAALQMQQDMKK